MQTLFTANLEKECQPENYKPRAYYIRAYYICLLSSGSIVLEFQLWYVNLDQGVKSGSHILTDHNIAFLSPYDITGFLFAL